MDDADLRAVFNMMGDNAAADSVDPLSTIRTSRGCRIVLAFYGVNGVADVRFVVPIN